MYIVYSILNEWLWSTFPFFLNDTSMLRKFSSLYFLPLLSVELDNLTVQLLESCSPFSVHSRQSLMCSFPFLNVLVSL